MSDPQARHLALLFALAVVAAFGLLFAVTMALDICGVDYQLPGTRP
jgi:hypothetical protein